MNPLREPDELLEAECNAHGLYGLPEPLQAAQAAGGWPGEPREDREHARRDAPRGVRLDGG